LVKPRPAAAAEESWFQRTREAAPAVSEDLLMFCTDHRGELKGGPTPPERGESLFVNRGTGFDAAFTSR